MIAKEAVAPERNTLAWFAARARRDQHRASLTFQMCNQLHASLTSCIPLGVQDSLARRADRNRKADA